MDTSKYQTQIITSENASNFEVQSHHHHGHKIDDDPKGGRNSNKTKPMVHKLGVTLEELYNGKVRCKWWDEYDLIENVEAS